MRNQRALYSDPLNLFQHLRKTNSSLKGCISTDSTQKTFQKWARVVKQHCEDYCTSERVHPVLRTVTVGSHNNSQLMVVLKRFEESQTNRFTANIILAKFNTKYVTLYIIGNVKLHIWVYYWVITWQLSPSDNYYTVLLFSLIFPRSGIELSNITIVGSGSDSSGVARIFIRGALSQ